MANKITELFLFPNYKIIIFDGDSPNKYYTVKDSRVCYSAINKNANYLCPDFYNERIDVSNCKMLGKLSELTEDKCIKLFQYAKYNPSNSDLTGYPDIANGPYSYTKSALKSLKSYLMHEGWSASDDRTWIIIPSPPKALHGNSIDVEFIIASSDFNTKFTTI